MEAWILILAIAWVIQYIRDRVSISRPFLTALPVLVCFSLVLLWTLIQSAPLPVELLGALSPNALDIHTTTDTEARLTLNLYASLESALKTLCYLLLFCLSILLINDKQRIRGLATVILLGGVFQATYGALMTLSGLEYGFFLQKEYNLGLATGTFVNRNHLAGYLEMCLAVGTGLMLADLSRSSAASWRHSIRRFLRTLLGDKARVRLALIMMVIGLVLTHSRMGNTAFFASLLSVGLFYLLVVRRVTRNTIIFFVSILIIDLFVIGNFFGIEEVAQRIQQTTVENEGRFLEYQDSVAVVRDYPLAGTGAGTFYSTFPMHNTGETPFGFYRHAHNDYLQFAVELGIPAFLLLGYIVLASLWSAIQAQLKRRDRLLQGMGFAATMAIVALMIHSTVDFNLQIPANAALFTVILALAWVCRYWDPLERA